MNNPIVSVVIPHYQDLERLDLCLGDLARQTFPADKFEVIVSDNGSPAGPEAVSRVVAGRAKLVITTEKGAGPARNGGVAAAMGEILAFTDSDCRPEPQWLSEGVAALKNYDFVGGRVKVLVNNRAAISAVEAFEAVFAFNFASYIRDKGFTGSGNLFCPRSLFDKVGGFKSTVSEDVEWSHRARDLGYRLGYAPAAVVGHPARRNWDELKAKWRRVNLEQYALARNSSAGRWRWLARSVLLPASAVVHTLKVLRSAELTSIGQRLKALAVLYRIRLWRFGNALALFIVDFGSGMRGR